MKDLWTYEGDFHVDKSMILDGKLIKDKIPDIVSGYFSCKHLELTSLIGCPTKVISYFDCSNNQLTSLKGAPLKYGGLYCSYNQLISLEGCPKKIEGHFYCSNNKLTTLEYGPKEVEGNFNCRYNQLTSLEGAPEKVERFFNCIGNQNLKSLEHCPKIIEKYLKSDLKTEEEFINSRSYISDYWEDLLKYMINEKLNLLSVEGWPKGFLTDEIIKSAKGISKFNL